MPKYQPAVRNASEKFKNQRLRTMQRQKVSAELKPTTPVYPTSAELVRQLTED